MNEITHDYVIIKLVNAETIVCVMVGEDDESFTVMYPIQMKPSRIELEGNKKEFQVGVPWIPYSDEKVFTIYKQDVVLLQKLNQATIEYYKNLVDMYVNCNLAGDVLRYVENITQKANNIEGVAGAYSRVYRNRPPIMNNNRYPSRY